MSCLKEKQPSSLSALHGSSSLKLEGFLFAQERFWLGRATAGRWSRAESSGWAEISLHKMPLSVSRDRRLLPQWGPTGAQETEWVPRTEFFFLFGHVIFGVTLLNSGHGIFPRLFYNWHSLCLICMFCCQIPVFSILFYFKFSRILEETALWLNKELTSKGWLNVTPDYSTDFLCFQGSA